MVLFTKSPMCEPYIYDIYLHIMSLFCSALAEAVLDELRGSPFTLR
jgi:hypothetical protein